MKLIIELYKKLYLIRKVEEVIKDNYFDDEMKTPMHMSKGEEAIVAGVCHALGSEDQVFGTYRSHALYLSKVGETDKFFAEMYGKKTGVAAGKSGSMHLSCPEKGYMSSSAIVASNIPVAVGAAWANKIKNNGKIVAVFFGDGAIDEGDFWESINMACLWDLPILFICEDNDLAVFTPSNKRHGYYNISDFMDQFNMTNYDYKTTRVDHVYYWTRKAIDDMKTHNHPSFIRFKYYRYLEHVGVNEDNVPGYREEDEAKYWDDPLEHCKGIMKNKVDQSQIDKIEEEVDKQVYRSLEFAQQSSFSDVKDLYKNVFYE
jgi:acetoin:2,6-dichlorophenolindophenol oxidoreductase subunit alpha